MWYLIVSIPDLCNLTYFYSLQLVRFGPEIEHDFKDLLLITHDLVIKPQQKITVLALFLNLSKKSCYHRNKGKMKILYGYVALSLYSAFQNQIHVVIGYAPFFLIMQNY